jgi:urease accessory protein
MTPDKVPNSFEKYGNYEAANGLARMSLARGKSSRTAVSHLETRAPLLVQRALYPDSRFPEMAHIYIMSSAGGILQGDRLAIEIDAKENTMSRITTQSATKIYKMEKGYAAQKVTVSARKNSYVEMVPRQLIPFKSSRFFQDVTIMADSGSTVLYCETLSAGRMASGERFDFDACFLRLQAYDSKSHLIFADAYSIEPFVSGKETLERLFGGRGVWSSISIVTDRDNAVQLEKEIGKQIRDGPMLAGCTILPNERGLAVRILDDSIDRVEGLIAAVTGIVRSRVAEIETASSSGSG